MIYLSVMKPAKTREEAWAETWLDAVAKGESTMSQRKLSSVETRGGGLAAVKKLAAKKKVHLLQLEDDRGEALIAASTRPFKVIR